MCHIRSYQIEENLANEQHFTKLKLFKAGAHGLWLCASGFLKSFLFARQYMCVCVCVSVFLPLRPLITSYAKHMHNKQIKQFYGFFVSS